MGTQVTESVIDNQDYRSTTAKAMTSLAHQSSSFLRLRPSTTTRRRIISRNQPSRLIISSEMKPKARFVAQRRETLTVEQQQRPLVEYMKLPASQYSVLDAERIERIDDNTFRCFVYRFKFLAFEVCPVLVVRVNEHPLGTCINLLSCKLEGSPIVVAQNHKFEASMENLISCDTNQTTSGLQQLSSDALIQVSIEIPFPFTAIPVETIESTGTQLLQQILGIMLPRFMKQLVKDYEAWASGDTSRQPLGTGAVISIKKAAFKKMADSLAKINPKHWIGFSEDATKTGALGRLRTAVSMASYVPCSKYWPYP